MCVSMFVDGIYPEKIPTHVKIEALGHMMNTYEWYGQVTTAAQWKRMMDSNAVELLLITNVICIVSIHSALVTQMIFR